MVQVIHYKVVSNVCAWVYGYFFTELEAEYYIKEYGLRNVHIEHL